MASWKKIRAGAALVAATLITASVLAVVPERHVAPPTGPTSEPVRLTPPLMPAEAGKPLPKTILT